MSSPGLPRAPMSPTHGAPMGPHVLACPCPCETMGSDSWDPVGQHTHPQSRQPMSRHAYTWAPVPTNRCSLLFSWGLNPWDRAHGSPWVPMPIDAWVNFSPEGYQQRFQGGRDNFFSGLPHSGNMMRDGSWSQVRGASTSQRHYWYVWPTFREVFPPRAVLVHTFEPLLPPQKSSK